MYTELDNTAYAAGSGGLT